MYTIRMVRNKSIKWWLGILSCMVLFLAIGAFSYMKMEFLWKGVQITAHVDQPNTSPVIYIKGNAKNAVLLSLNGREIFIDKEGMFTEPIALLPGMGVVTIDAQDKFGKVAQKKFNILYENDKGAVAIGDVDVHTN